jgi:hypothetical protein
MAIKRSSQGGTPFGTTANRPANPAVGQTYYNGTLGYLEIYTASGWAAAAKGIAFGNTANRPASPDLGTPYFNGQEARLELYTGNGWQNIVQETPAVVSVVGQLNETTTSTLTINGTNFAAGAQAFVVGTNGVETVANTTTLVSVVEVTAVFPALPPANGPYDVKIVNPSNLYGVLYETLGVNDAPIWSTSAGSLGTFTELDVISITTAVSDTTDSTNSPLQYTLVSGSLPAGLSLNSTTGVISGTATNALTNTTYSFTLGASDSRNTVQTRAFSITINDRSPVWVTSSALPVFTRNAAYSTSVSATEDESGAITYSLISGSLPTGLTLSSAGLISGTPTSSINTSFTIRATVTASGNTADRAFTMANLAPVWSTASGALTSALKDTAYSYQLVVSDDNTITYSLLSGSLPTGITLSSSGLLSGTPTVGSAGTPSSFTIRATDTNSVSVDRAFTILVVQSNVVTFTSTQSWVAPSTTSQLTHVVVVGGGGGGSGGAGAGGSGGGGAAQYTNVAVTPGSSYTVTIGGGGSSGGWYVKGGAGVATTGFGYTQNGGIAGGQAASGTNLDGGASGNGYTGGAGNGQTQSGSGVGGGGASSAGNGSSYNGGNGGAAGAVFTASLNGVTYGGGSGGGSYNNGNAGSGGGIGGAGYSTGSNNNTVTNGEANRGGAAGAQGMPNSGGPFATGGSGVVIIRYLS